jgi:4-alpha-glucanotransferase
MANAHELLVQLAEAYGVYTSYDNDQGKRQEASPEALLAVLRILGASLQRPDEAGEALRQHRQEQWRQQIEPVLVAWDGRPSLVSLRLPASAATGTLGCRLEFESGKARSWSCPIGDLPVAETAVVEGVTYTVRSLTLPQPLPIGYHRLTLQLGGTNRESLVLSPPLRAYDPPGAAAVKTWGVFLPMYAIRSSRNLGCGDFTDLENLLNWTHSLGGGVIGTLPFLAAFLDEPFEPSPYSAASRLFWNELFIDVTRAAEFSRCPEARAYLDGLGTEVVAVRNDPLVDYRRIASLKRRALEMLARTFFTDPAGRRTSFESFVRANPRLEDYARFRAAGERRCASWWGWEDRLRNGTIQEGDYDEESRRYHLYVQWLADEQLQSLAERARDKGPGLYLDFPLGVNPDSYDVWRDRPSFALGVSAGAPPDVFFTKGQEWGFPPLHPENIRTHGYHYLRDCLKHHLKYAGMLRIDHMMGLHRFFWVPHELGPRRGVYVRYPAEELYAVYNLESNRHQAVLVGEDLGTVPPAVRPAMERHNIHRLYVGQFEMEPRPDPAINVPPAGAVASMNTHDTPTFAAFWRGLDVEDRKAMGLFDDTAAWLEQERRSKIREAVVAFLRRAGYLGQDADVPAVLRGSLDYIARGPVQVVLANLEDLWQATEPQNVPGTWREKPNWRRKALHALESFDHVSGVRDTLMALDRAVRGRG